MSPKSQREDTVAGLASRVFSAMLEDIVLDTALQSHHEVIRSRAVCHVCHTRCGTAHVPSTSISQLALPSSRPSTPLGDPKVGNGPLATGTSTPTSVKADGINYLECVNCNRVISSNRYAPHLSSCLGISRRVPMRASYTKPKNSSEGGRSLSPSENGTLSDDGKTIKEKGKSKSKRAGNSITATSRKRLESPQVSPSKKAKRQKAAGSSVARVMTETDTSIVSSNLSPSNSHLKVPSKLRSSSTASLFDYERSFSPGSPSSLPATPVASISTPTSSAISGQSPIFTNGGKRKPQKTKAKPFSNPPPRAPSPPRPPPPQISMPEPGYLIDVEADETGSSTDTDGP